MNAFSLSLRMLRRDLRAGELGLLLIALVIAVTSLTSVGFFTDRVAQALTREANQLLGGDLVVVSDHPLNPVFRDEAGRRGLKSVVSSTFTSMASFGEGAQLAGVKVVEGGHPLRGAIRIAPGLNQPDAPAKGIPAPGELWLDERLASALGARPGDMIGLGASRLRMAAVLSFESDRGANFFSLLPRLVMNAADLPATSLIQPGSRVFYRLHVAGEIADVAGFEAWAKPKLQRGETLENVDNARPEVRSTLDRTERFLRFAAMLAVVLAAVAVGLATRRFVDRHLDGCAVMRCVGASQSQLLRLFLGEFALLGLAAGVVGCVLGFGVQFVLNGLLGELVGFPLPAPGWWPVAHGLAVSLLLLMGFALPPLIRLGRVSTLRVLRREWDGLAAREGLAWAVGALVLAGLLVGIARDWLLGLWVVGGFALAFTVYGLVGWLVLGALGRVRAVASSGWRYGLASLRRRPVASLVQVLALGMGLTALLLLTLVRGDLLDNWKQATPADAPNRFVINIQPDQLDPLRKFFKDEGRPAPNLQPMIRGRLVAVNGRPVSADDYTDDRAKRLVDRDFNLSFDTRLPSGNSVVAGQWHGDSKTPAFSVEQGLAQTLGLAMGDLLTFEIAGNRSEARVTSLRKLDWDSMRVNFFVVAGPGMLESFPASYITSFYLPATQMDFANRMVAAFPNFTVIDVAAVIGQIQGMVEQLIAAVQFVFGFAVVAGVIVLFGALQATHDEREKEMAILRTLGARNAQLRSALLAEFAVLGLVAGVLAGVGATAIGWALAHFVFKLPYAPSVLPLLVGAVAGCAVVVLAGWFGTRHLLSQPPLASLRALS
ncbi:FtsX-like permease family protein [Zoogloea oleivorans]|uniref:FtsX-like permease family protein n=1 Tax=Zoogloea oleivorans TaxID=1552750 RepID=A0A6C2CQ13_9RHOO|nr:FtsX-like permease family protein [Zoogloea oleivorans]TYC56207.1 FtsX-like permease family protein [Zoogloea oleivorans]